MIGKAGSFSATNFDREFTRKVKPVTGDNALVERIRRAGFKNKEHKLTTIIMTA
jgi:hypothetical protein